MARRKWAIVVCLFCCVTALWYAVSRDVEKIDGSTATIATIIGGDDIDLLQSPTYGGSSDYSAGLIGIGVHCGGSELKTCKHSGDSFFPCDGRYPYCPGALSTVMEGKPLFGCSGVRISKHFILTAHHCRRYIARLAHEKTIVALPISGEVGNASLWVASPIKRSKTPTDGSGADWQVFRITGRFPREDGLSDLPDFNSYEVKQLTQSDDEFAKLQAYGHPLGRRLFESRGAVLSSCATERDDEVVINTTIDSFQVNSGSGVWIVRTGALSAFVGIIVRNFGEAYGARDHSDRDGLLSTESFRPKFTWQGLCCSIGPCNSPCMKQYGCGPTVVLRIDGLRASEDFNSVCTQISHIDSGGGPLCSDAM